MTAAPSSGALSLNPASQNYADFSGPPPGPPQTSFFQTLQDAQRSSDPGSDDDADDAGPATDGTAGSAAGSSLPDGSTPTGKTPAARSQQRNATKGAKRSAVAGDSDETDEADEADQSGKSNLASTVVAAVDDSTIAVKTAKSSGKKTISAEKTKPATTASAAATGVGLSHPAAVVAKSGRAATSDATDTDADPNSTKAVAATGDDEADDDSAAADVHANAGQKQTKTGSGVGSANVLKAKSPTGLAAASGTEDDQDDDAGSTTAGDGTSSSFDDLFQAMTGIDPDEGESTAGSAHAAAPAVAAIDATGSAGGAAAAGGVAPPQLSGAAKVAAAPPAPAPSSAEITEANHAKIVSSIHGQLLPNGGSMQIRLDPPELGTVQVSVHMRNGVLTAEFETSNDDAAKMLSRSLGQLKSTLEAAGVSVEKLHVQQSTKQQGKQTSDDSGEEKNATGQGQTRQQNQHQQRRELMDRLWRKMAGVDDPVDLVA